MDQQKMVFLDCYEPPMNCVYIISEAACAGKCAEKKCLYVCPTGLFRENGGEVKLDLEGVCLECGACRLICDNINFDFPPAGRGVIHQFG